MPDINMGQMTPLVVPKNPQANARSFGARVKDGLAYMISGVTPQTWFGPMQPLAPMAPDDVKGRAFDYPTGYNLNYVPRSYERYSFSDLRSLADNCDMLRTIIENRKDQIAGGEWVIRPKQRDIYAASSASTSRSNIDIALGNATPDQQSRIAKITEFLASPDKELDWDQWIRVLLEDLYVIDAPTIYRRYTRGGDLYALEILDGATIKPLLDADGRRPRAPDPAYQQILHGIPAADFTQDELYYWKRNTRSNRVYGYSPVEQVLLTINTAIRRAVFQLQYYLEGSQPDAFMGLPESWGLKQIKEFQEYMDTLLSGKLGERRKLRFMPGQFKYQETKSPPLKDEYDEWLARVICFAFAISPEPFVQRVNRATAQVSDDRSQEDGRGPQQKWIKGGIDKVIQFDFKSPDLEFMYIDDRETDPLKQMQIDTGYVKTGIKSINETRAMRGASIRPGVCDSLMVMTAVGYVPVGTLAPTGNSQNAPANQSDGGDPHEIGAKPKPQSSGTSETHNASEAAE